MGNITFNFFRLSVAILSFADKSHGLYFESLLCANHEAKLNCTVGNSIDDINITFHDVQDACITTDEFHKGTSLALDSMSYSSCTGHNSCVLTDKMFNISQSVLDKTRKLLIVFDCVHESTQHHFRKPSQSVCPFNMKSVNCTQFVRKIEIQSVEFYQYLSCYEKQNLNMLNKNCTECIQMEVNASCNGKQICEQLTWNECSDCSRLPTFVNISFSCKAIPNALPLQAESNVEGIAVGVTVGILIIVGVVVVYMWFVRRKKLDDRHNIAHHHENADNIGNQNMVVPANCNSEISKNLELRNFNSKQNNYEMAKPMNESDYDENGTISEKDNYVFHEDQYDVSRGHYFADHHQGIYGRAVDTVYDSASHSRQNTVTDQTYDHAYGLKTEDNYDIAKN
ncbi:unnamed protein product [Mytilus coruscus]|uniref:Uncharacterized protein n=1 Tax=Mytilus coruscus TaxID=42192 RepID=A0A6J8C8Z3_MYTCO|nr:unnamed protein product [Mytilus coruscus]